MSVEGGSMSGGGSGGVSGGGGLGSGGIGPAAGIGPSVSVGIESSGLTGAGVSPGGFGGFGEFGDLGQFKALGPSAFGPEATVLSSPIVNEGPVGRSFLENSVPLQLGGSTEISFNSVSTTEPLSPQAAIAETENIIIEAKERPTAEPIPFVLFNDKSMSKVEKKLTAIATLGAVEKPQTENALATQTVAETKEEIKPLLAIQPVLKEERAQEVVTEKIIQKPSGIINEELEEDLKLKDVVDKKVLSTRIEEFKGYVEKAGLEAEALKIGQKEAGKDIEIDGEGIVSMVTPETEDKRSGLVKKTGPDGSREEVIEEIAPKRFKSVKEAKDYIVTAIIRRVPVKKAKEGQEVGRKDVARVLRKLFLKDQPKEQEAAKIVKKRQLQSNGKNMPVQVAFVSDKQNVEPSEPDIKDYPGLTEVFQKVV